MYIGKSFLYVRPILGHSYRSKTALTADSNQRVSCGVFSMQIGKNFLYVRPILGHSYRSKNALSAILCRQCGFLCTNARESAGRTENMLDRQSYLGIYLVFANNFCAIKQRKFLRIGPYKKLNFLKNADSAVLLLYGSADEKYKKMI